MATDLTNLSESDALLACDEAFVHIRQLAQGRHQSIASLSREELQQELEKIGAIADAFHNVPRVLSMSEVDKQQLSWLYRSGLEKAVIVYAHYRLSSTVLPVSPALASATGSQSTGKPSFLRKLRTFFSH